MRLYKEDIRYMIIQRYFLHLTIDDEVFLGSFEMKHFTAEGSTVTASKHLSLFKEHSSKILKTSF